MKIIGLTGSIATGKSEVAKLLRKMGFPVIDADRVARDVVSPGSPVLTQLVARFGNDSLLPDGNLDRLKLAQKVFGNPAQLKSLNAITHSAILAQIQKEITHLEQQGIKVVFLEVPLLYETGMDRWCAAVIVVVSNPQVQLERLKNRSGLTDDEAHARIAAQLPQEKKRALAEYLIDNSGHILQAETRLQEILREIVK